jgi:hypothetical protein
MLTTIQKKRRVATAVGAAVQVLLQLAGDAPFTGRCNEELLRELLLRSHAILRSLEEQKQVGFGNGRSLKPRMPTLLLPSSDRFGVFVLLPDQFQNECGFSPSEFGELLGDVMDVMLLVRDVDHDYGPELNAQRRKRRFKYSARERLFIFLTYCRQYQSYDRTGQKWAWCRSSIYADFLWLRKNLVQHTTLVSAVYWGTPQECEADRVSLVNAGVLPPGFETTTFICDGTKDLGKRSRIYAEQERDYSFLKGHGKSHLLFCDLFGRVGSFAPRYPTLRCTALLRPPYSISLHPTSPASRCSWNMVSKGTRMIAARTE